MFLEINEKSQKFNTISFPILFDLWITLKGLHGKCFNSTQTKKLLKPLTFCVQCIEDKNTLERKPTVAVKLYDFQELNAELPLVTMKRVLHQMLPPNINYVGNINYHQTTM